MTAVIDRTDEKLKLAEELGIEQYLKTRKLEQIKKEAVNELTGMKFNPITQNEIEAKITNYIWDWKSLNTSERLPAIILSTFIFGVVAFINYIIPEIARIPMHIPAAIWMTIITITTLSCYRKTVMREDWISSWKDELPYGAFLAIKEAKEKGIDGFYGKGRTDSYKIYYPVLASSRDRLKADPVITGLYKGVEVEIFAWDDSKVYE